MHTSVNLLTQNIENRKNYLGALMSNRRRFNIDISKDEDGLIDVSISNSQDFNSNLEFDDLVKRLEGVFLTKGKK